MTSATAPILAIDFDGVICDSTEECVVTAWNAWNLYINKTIQVTTPDQVPNPFRSALRAHRNYVRTAGEYLILLEAALSGKYIRSQRDYDNLFEQFDNSISAFAKLFFSARSRLRSQDEKHWLNLHSVYTGIPMALAQLWKTFDVSIVTGKDASSVQTFFKLFGLPIPSSRVFDKDVAHDKLAAIRMIAANEGQPLNSTFFVDDNIHHLVPAHEAGCHAYLAGWGYHTDEQLELARRLSIPILSLEGWVDVLFRSGQAA
jgi:phosphoglycolate phosphatase-like HAD superfamily hydrolase